MTDNVTPDAAEIAAIREMLEETCKTDVWHIQEAVYPNTGDWLEIVSQHGTVVAKVYCRDDANVIVTVPVNYRRLLAAVEAQAARIGALESENAALRAKLHAGIVDDELTPGNPVDNDPAQRWEP